MSVGGRSARHGPPCLGVPHGQSGQMTVELAILVPVVIAVALVVANLMEFVDACAAFDRLSLDEVIAEGVSPAGEQSVAASVAAVETRYTCTMVFRPWPRELRLPGITYVAPLELRHERTLVIDRYRPGVVV